jgi:hypothetical protein
MNLKCAILTQMFFNKISKIPSLGLTSEIPYSIVNLNNFNFTITYYSKSLLLFASAYFNL